MNEQSALVIGESLIDIVTTSTGHTTEVVGGSPANVALGLARQQVPVRLLTSLGRDARGERIREHLASSGVEVIDDSWSLQTTSTARAQITADGSAAYVFDISWVLPETIDAGGARLIHVGSIGAFLDPGARTLERWLSRRSPETVITFDPNIRPALLSDKRAALARFERLARMSHVIKLSDEDASWLYPNLTPAQIIRKLLGFGARLVALTMGGSGAILSTEEASIELAAPNVRVRDTVGAGDTFMAALIRRVIENPDLLVLPTSHALAAAGRYAIAAAALTVQRTGADLPTAADILASIPAEPSSAARFGVDAP